MLTFMSKDMDGTKTFYRTEYEHKDFIYVFRDKSVENTMVYLTVLKDVILFERKGDVSMHLELKMMERRPGMYEAKNGLAFSFTSLCTEMEMSPSKLHFRYSLFVGDDMVSKQEIWIAF